MSSSSVDYWLKQDPAKPLFPDLIWSRPENKAQAGKLLIVGGSAHSFNDMSSAYSSATEAGIGAATLLLPDSLQKTLANVLSDSDFAPSTIGGGFSRQTLSQLLSLSAWADATLLAGDFGKNSETTILLESFTQKYDGLLTITGDAVDHYLVTAKQLLARPKTILVLSLPQLQKLSSSAKLAKAFTSTMDLLHMVSVLHEVTLEYSSAVITYHKGYLIASANGQVSTTQKTLSSNWQSSVASRATVWALQNPNNSFAAITSALI